MIFLLIIQSTRGNGTRESVAFLYVGWKVRFPSCKQDGSLNLHEHIHKEICGQNSLTARYEQNMLLWSFVASSFFHSTIQGDEQKLLLDGRVHYLISTKDNVYTSSRQPLCKFARVIQVKLLYTTSPKHNRHSTQTSKFIFLFECSLGPSIFPSTPFQPPV